MLREVSELYPDLTFEEFIDEVRRQLYSFLRRNAENEIRRMRWAYRIVSQVVISETR